MKTLRDIDVASVSMHSYYLAEKVRGITTALMEMNRTEINTDLVMATHSANTINYHVLIYAWSVALDPNMDQSDRLGQIRRCCHNLVRHTGSINSKIVDLSTTAAENARICISSTTKSAKRLLAILALDPLEDEDEETA